MTNDLKQLLNDSAAHAPAEPHTVNDIVRSAQLAHRNHVAKLVGGSALALALVVGVGYTAITHNGSDDAQPVRKLEHGPVKTIDRGDLKDARTLVEGKDYDVLAEFRGSDVPAWSWSPDDFIVVKKGEEHVAVNGQDGTETALSGHPSSRYTPIAVGDDHVVWMDKDSPDRLVVEDLSSGDEHDLMLRLPGLKNLSTVTFYRPSIEAGRIWGTVPADDPESDQLVTVSAPLDGGSGFRREIDATVSSAAVADGKLAWTEGNGEPLMVRDLDSGEVSQIAEQPEQNCRFSVSGVSARRVVTTETCSKRDGQARLSDDGTVWSLDGGPTIEFPGNSMMFGGLADDRVLFQLYSGNGDLATYAYSFDTAEVFELGTVTTDEFGSQDQWPTRASGDRVTFPSPETKGDLALVELRP